MTDWFDLKLGTACHGVYWVMHCFSQISQRDRSFVLSNLHFA